MDDNHQWVRFKFSKHWTKVFLILTNKPRFVIYITLVTISKLTLYVDTVYRSLSILCINRPGWTGFPVHLVDVKTKLSKSFFSTLEKLILITPFKLNCIKPLGLSLHNITSPLYAKHFSPRSIRMYASAFLHHSSTIVQVWWLLSKGMISTYLSHTDSQYHGCWWPGDVRSQVISSHGNDLIYR